MKMPAIIRLMTIRDGYPSAGVYEAIEAHTMPNGSVFLAWRAVEPCQEAFFPCDLAFAQEKFAAAGRTFDANKLPGPLIVNPYAPHPEITP